MMKTPAIDADITALFFRCLEGVLIGAGATFGGSFEVEGGGLEGGGLEGGVNASI
ncbi:hypothetical protein TIFTF001_036820 [Ficus carica]|uniref:Uncharacterized protein n=1 Tax=Ficus carica TaxID=3494 RepID=A0AA88E454_FICCA|nr:hypothetical protein TIFTF001_036818 [Ficus carica]GMN67767.1 hypothetical protein TIFTF001_036820 [Ficus carica]